MTVIRARACAKPHVLIKMVFIKESVTICFTNILKQVLEYSSPLATYSRHCTRVFHIMLNKIVTE